MNVLTKLLQKLGLLKKSKKSVTEEVKLSEKTVASDDCCGGGCGCSH